MFLSRKDDLQGHVTIFYYIRRRHLQTWRMGELFSRVNGRVKLGEEVAVSKKALSFLGVDNEAVNTAADPFL